MAHEQTSQVYKSAGTIVVHCNFPWQDFIFITCMLLVPKKKTPGYRLPSCMGYPMKIHACVCTSASSILAAARPNNICHGLDRCVISTDIKKIIGWNIIFVSPSSLRKKKTLLFKKINALKHKINIRKNVLRIIIIA